MRRRQSSERRNPYATMYDAANYPINQMEYAVVKAMNPFEGLSADDLLDWLVPGEELGLLKRAYPHMQDPPSTRYVNFDYDPDTEIHLDIECDKLRILPPRRNLLRMDPEAPKADALRAGIETLIDIQRQHGKLRRLVGWFNTNKVTPGAARHYFPSMAALIKDSQHPFHKVGGDRFKQVAFPHEIAETLREASAIVAKGTMCDPKTNGMPPHGMAVGIRVGNGSLTHAMFV